MTNIKHLTQNELSAYHHNTLEIAERQQVRKHLLNCADCRKRLPLPSVEQFWAAIMNDADGIAAPVKREEEYSPNSIFSGVTSFMKLQSCLLWSSALLIIVLSFSFLVWLSVADSSSELVQTSNNRLETELNFPLSEKTPANEKHASSTNSNRIVVNPPPKITKPEVKSQTITKPEVSKPRILQNNAPQISNKSSLKQKEIISATRGVAGNCQEEKSFGIEFVASKENFVFKWKKVPKAVKYHLFISDDEEVLIDEYETSNETTFVLKKPLDPLKTYRWKIIVTLENGNKIIGASQKFTANNFQLTRGKPEKKLNPVVRCGTKS